MKMLYKYLLYCLGNSDKQKKIVHIWDRCIFFPPDIFLSAIGSIHKCIIHKYKVLTASHGTIVFHLVSETCFYSIHIFYLGKSKLDGGCFEFWEKWELAHFLTIVKIFLSVLMCKGPTLLICVTCPFKFVTLVNCGE